MPRLKFSKILGVRRYHIIVDDSQSTLCGRKGFMVRAASRLMQYSRENLCVSCNRALLTLGSEETVL